MVKRFFNVIIVLMALCLATSNIIVHAQPYAWAKGLVGPSIGGIVADDEGNVYVTGMFSDTVDFDPGPRVVNLICTPGVTGSGFYDNPADIFIAKYDAQGNYIWAKRIGGSGYECAYSIALDKYDNIYITGMFRSDTADFDPDQAVANLYSKGGSNLFFAKYDSDGNYIWAKMAENSGGYGIYITVDEAGALFITGMFETDPSGLGADFDPGPGTAYLKSGTSLHSTYFAKYDTDGHYLWAYCPDHSESPVRFMGWSWGQSVAVDKAGNAYFIGNFNGVGDFNPGPDSTYLGGGPQSPGYESSYITKYDSAGNYVGAVAIVGEWPQSLHNAPFIMDIAVDDADNLYVTGSTRGVVDFDPGPGIANLGMAGLRAGLGILVKYDNTLNFVWGKTIGDSLGTANGRRIKSYGSRLYLTGGMSGNNDFDPGPGIFRLKASGRIFREQDVFVSQYDTSGEYVCAQRMGGLGQDEAFGMAINKKGNVYAAGSFQDTVDFDPGPGVGNLISNLINPLGQSAFIVKLACKDSIATLKVSLCGDEGESYTLNGSTYTNSGIYTQVLPNGSLSCGCDSIIELNLVIDVIVKPEITIDEFTLGLTSTYASYQWFKNGIEIPGATGSKYLVTENADYAVAVTNDKGCTDTSAKYKVSNVSVYDVMHIADQIRIYPNPSTDVVTIQRPTSILWNITVSGIAGNTIVNAGNVTHISLKELAAGIYFLRISDKEGNLIKIAKLVKQ